MSEIIKITGQNLFVRQHKSAETLTDNVLIASQNEGAQITASDGYHTFEELYDHRITLFIALCRIISNINYAEGEIHKVWRSKVNGDGSTWEDYFIMGIGKEKGKQITYHLPLTRWEETEFAETLDQAPEFDGHSSEDVLERLKRL